MSRDQANQQPSLALQYNSLTQATTSTNRFWRTSRGSASLICRCSSSTATRSSQWQPSIASTSPHSKNSTSSTTSLSVSRASGRPTGPISATCTSVGMRRCRLESDPGILRQPCHAPREHEQADHFGIQCQPDRMRRPSVGAEGGSAGAEISWWVCMLTQTCPTSTLSQRRLRGWWCASTPNDKKMIE